MSNRRRARGWFIIAAATIPLAACDSPTGVSEDVAITVYDPEIVASEERVSMRARVIVDNGSIGPIGFARCGAGFQKREADGWVAAADYLCAEVTYFWLSPSEAGSYEWSSTRRVGDLIDSPYDGEYRFVAEILDRDVRTHLVYSEPFYIEPTLR